MRAIIFANGQFPDPATHRRLLRPDDLVIAANGGAQNAQAAGIVPHVIIGDLDSLTRAVRAELTAAGAQLITHPAEKDETDLELALLHAAEQGADEILVLAALGGRLDHLIANLLLLTLPQLEGCAVTVIEGNQTAFLIRGETLVRGSPGDTISLIPLGGDARGVTATGLRWPLDDETLRFGPARGVSNVLLEEEAAVNVREGTLLCILTRGRPDLAKE